MADLHLDGDSLPQSALMTTQPNGPDRTGRLIGWEPLEGSTVREFAQWGNLLHSDARPIDGQEPGTVDISISPPHSGVQDSFAQYRHNRRVEMGIGDTVMRRTVRVVTTYGPWEEA